MRPLAVAAVVTLVAGSSACSACEDPQPLEQVVGVSAGWAHTCAVTQAGRVWCWGGNDRGQLGTGDTDDAGRAVRATGLDQVEMVSAGTGTCALRRDGSVWCWGLPWLEPGAAPVAAEGVCAAERVVVGDEAACAGCRDGSVECWAEAARGAVDAGWKHASHLAVAGARVCAVTQRHRVECARWREAAPVIEPVELPGAVRSLSAGGGVLCAVVEGSGVRCWTADDPSAAVVVDLPDARAVTVARATEACALTGGVTSTCWRMTREGGQLALVERSWTVRELPFTTEELTAGPSRRCIRTRLERVYCWDADHRGAVDDALVIGRAP